MLPIALQKLRKVNDRPSKLDQIDVRSNTICFKYLQVFMRHQSSWVRYAFARLRPLGRPVFWAPSIALLLLILFTWEFFSGAKLASNFGISAPDETLSREDQAIGADIDSLPLLMNDIKITPKSETAQIAPSQDSAQPNSATPNRLFSAPSDAIPSAQVIAPPP